MVDTSGRSPAFPSSPSPQRAVESLMHGWGALERDLRADAQTRLGGLAPFQQFKDFRVPLQLTDAWGASAPASSALSPSPKAPAEQRSNIGGILVLSTPDQHRHSISGDTASADVATGSFGVPPPPADHVYWAPSPHQGRVLHVPPPQLGCAGLPRSPSSSASSPQRQPPDVTSHPHALGLPRVATAPTFHELSETLNNSAHRNLSAVRAALQNAQASIHETATNCQANLQALTSLLQASGGKALPVPATVSAAPRLGAGALVANPLQAALSSSRAVVTWTLTNASDPFGGALLPWQHVIPRVVGGGRQQQQQALAPGALGPLVLARPLPLVAQEARQQHEAQGGGKPRGGALMDWVAPLEQYMHALPAAAAGEAGQQQQQRGGGPAGQALLAQQLFLGSGRRQATLRDPGRQVAIVTTASLPWLTGTAVNPLLRAAYLASDASRRVTLVLPWLSPADQQRVFPAMAQFETPEQQEEYVRAWARQRTGLNCDFKIAFYPSRYAAEKGSILPVGDITQVIPDHEADVAVLEEPEHLNWYHHGTRWTDKFKHVVGVMHTNYLDYARREENGGVKEQLLKHINAWVCRIHCHKVIKLSDAVQPLPREDTMFVHGVSPAFLKVGASKAHQASWRQQQLQLLSSSPAADADAVVGAPATPANPASPWAAAAAHLASMLPFGTPHSAACGGGSGGGGDGVVGEARASEAPAAPPDPLFQKGAYFLGKVLWAKGYTELLDRLNEHTQRTGQQVEVDVYGSGPDLKAVEEEASKRRLALHFNGARDHADEALQDYKVFINPSLSDVVATTTAEALAMGKWVVCADHPSNKFFQRFPNCLIYRDSEEFSQCLSRALEEEPRPLSEAQLHELTWEAATERFLDVANLPPATGLGTPLEAGLDKVLHVLHNTLTGVEALRVAAGAGACTRDMPARVTDYTPDENDVGGLLDNAARAKKSWKAGGKGSGSPAPAQTPMSSAPASTPSSPVAAEATGGVGADALGGVSGMVAEMRAGFGVGAGAGGTLGALPQRTAVRV